MTSVRFNDFAAKDPQGAAIVDPSGRCWSRGEIVAAVNRLARSLREAGVQPGEVMAIVAPNCAEYLIAYLAGTQVGMLVVPVNWHLAPPEIQYILDDCKAQVVVAHARCGAALEKIAALMRHAPPIRLAIGGPVAGFTDVEEFTRGADDAPLEDPVTGRVLGYTSATTGKPKGVLLPLSGADTTLDLAISRRVQVGMALETDVVLILSMLYHGAPLETAVVGLHMGNAVVLVDRMTPELSLQLIEKYKVTILYVVPSMFSRLLALPEATRARYSTASLQRVQHTGVACPVEIKRRMIDWWGPILWEAYAAAEGGGTLVGSADWLKYPGTVGRPIPDTRVLIVDDDGRELPTGEAGTIYMTRYAGDRFEYLGDPQKTAAAHRGEYFTIGDIGYLNEEGFLFLCDRKIDMINLGGLKVYPAEIEGILILHPQVADCAVIGVPEPVLGEAVMAIVQPAPDAKPGAELRSSITKFLSGHLGAAKIPQFIEFVPELPREATGKLQKRRLREKYTSHAMARQGLRHGNG